MSGRGIITITPRHSSFEWSRIDPAYADKVAAWLRPALLPELDLSACKN